MADFNIVNQTNRGRNIRFTIPAAELSKIIFPPDKQSFSIQLYGSTGNVSFRYDGGEASLDDVQTYPINVSNLVSGYASLYAEHAIPFISIISDIEVVVLVYNVY